MEEKRFEEVDTEEVIAYDREKLREYTGPQFYRMVAETLKLYPLGKNFASRCYCRRCNASWEMTEKGVQKLKALSPNGQIKIPEGITDLEQDLSKYVFIIEPCFLCRGKKEKMHSEARCIIDASNYSNYKKKQKISF